MYTFMQRLRGLDTLGYWLQLIERDDNKGFPLTKENNAPAFTTGMPKVLLADATVTGFTFVGFFNLPLHPLPGTNVFTITHAAQPQRQLYIRPLAPAAVTPAHNYELWFNDDEAQPSSPACALRFQLRDSLGSFASVAVRYSAPSASLLAAVAVFEGGRLRGAAVCRRALGVGVAFDTALLGGGLLYSNVLALTAASFEMYAAALTDAEVLALAGAPPPTLWDGAFSLTAPATLSSLYPAANVTVRPVWSSGAAVTVAVRTRAGAYAYPSTLTFTSTEPQTVLLVAAQAAMTASVYLTLSDSWEPLEAASACVYVRRPNVTDVPFSQLLDTAPFIFVPIQPKDPATGVPPGLHFSLPLVSSGGDDLSSFVSLNTDAHSSGSPRSDYLDVAADLVPALGGSGRWPLVMDAGATGLSVVLLLQLSTEALWGSRVSVNSESTLLSVWDAALVSGLELSFSRGQLVLSVNQGACVASAAAASVPTGVPAYLVVVLTAALTQAQRCEVYLQGALLASGTVRSAGPSLASLAPNTSFVGRSGLGSNNGRNLVALVGGLAYFPYALRESEVALIAAEYGGDAKTLKRPVPLAALLAPKACVYTFDTAPANALAGWSLYKYAVGAGLVSSQSGVVTNTGSLYIDLGSQADASGSASLTDSITMAFAFSLAFLGPQPQLQPRAGSDFASAAYTFMAWVRVSYMQAGSALPIPVGARLLDCSVDGAKSSNVLLVTGPTRALSWQVYRGGEFVGAVTTPDYAYLRDQWVHVAVRTSIKFTTPTTALFVNGALAATSRDRLLLTALPGPPSTALGTCYLMADASLRDRTLMSVGEVTFVPRGALSRIWITSAASAPPPSVWGGPIVRLASRPRLDPSTCHSPTASPLWIDAILTVASTLNFPYMYDGNDSSFASTDAVAPFINYTVMLSSAAVVSRLRLVLSVESSLAFAGRQLRVLAGVGVTRELGVFTLPVGNIFVGPVWFSLPSNRSPVDTYVLEFESTPGPAWQNTTVLSIAEISMFDSSTSSRCFDEAVTFNFTVDQLYCVSPSTGTMQESLDGMDKAFMSYSTTEMGRTPAASINSSFLPPPSSRLCESFSISPADATALQTVSCRATSINYTLPMNNFLSVGFTGPRLGSNGSIYVNSPFLKEHFAFAGTDMFSLRVQGSAEDYSARAWGAQSSAVTNRWARLGILGGPGSADLLSFDGGSNAPPADFNIGPDFSASNPFTLPCTFRMHLFRPYSLTSVSSNLVSLIVGLKDQPDKYWLLRVNFTEAAMGVRSEISERSGNATLINALYNATKPWTTGTWNDVTLVIHSMAHVEVMLDGIVAVATRSNPIPYAGDVVGVAEQPSTLTFAYPGGFKSAMYVSTGIRWFPRALRPDETALLASTVPGALSAVTFLLSPVPVALPPPSPLDGLTTGDWSHALEMTASYFLPGEYTVLVNASGCAVTPSVLTFGVRGQGVARSVTLSNLSAAASAVTLSFAVLVWAPGYALPQPVTIPYAANYSGSAALQQGLADAAQAQVLTILAVNSSAVSPLGHYTTVPGGPWGTALSFSAAGSGLNLSAPADVGPPNLPLGPAFFDWAQGFTVAAHISVASIPPVHPDTHECACVFQFSDPSWVAADGFTGPGGVSRMALELVPPAGLRFRITYRDMYASEVVPLPLGKWVHVALVVSGSARDAASEYPLGSMVGLYLNGVLASLRPVGADIALSLRNIGSQYTSLVAGSCPSSGSASGLAMASFVLYRRALPPSLMATLAQVLPTFPLVRRVTVARPVVALEQHPTQLSAGDSLLITAVLVSKDALTAASSLRVRWGCSDPSLDLANVTGRTLALPSLQVGTYTFTVMVSDADPAHVDAAGRPASGAATSLAVAVVAAPPFEAPVAQANPCLGPLNPCDVGGRCVATLLGSVQSGPQTYKLACECFTSPYLFLGRRCSFAVLACPSCTSRYVGGATLTVYGLGLDRLLPDLRIGNVSTPFTAAHTHNSTEGGEVASITQALLRATGQAEAQAQAQAPLRLQSITFVTPSLVRNFSEAEASEGPGLVNPVSAYQPLTVSAVPSELQPLALAFTSLVFYSSSQCVAEGVFKDDGRGDCLSCPRGGYCQRKQKKKDIT